MDVFDVVSSLSVQAQRAGPMPAWGNAPGNPCEMKTSPEGAALRDISNVSVAPLGLNDFHDPSGVAQADIATAPWALTKQFIS